MDQRVATYAARFNLGAFLAPALLEQLSVRRYARGEQILAIGEPVGHLHLLVEGRVKVMLPTAQGRQLLLCYYGPLQLLGDVEIFEREPVATTTVEALQPCVCLELRRELVLATLADDPVFLRELSVRLGRKLSRAVRNSALNLLYPVEQRVASYVLATAASNEAGELVFAGNLTQVAELLGTSFRHLHRTLAALCAEGLLRKERVGYVVDQPRELERRSGDAYIVP